MACSPELSWIMLHFVVGARIHEVEEMVCLPELDHASVCKKVCKTCEFGDKVLTNLFLMVLSHVP